MVTEQLVQYPFQPDYIELNGNRVAYLDEGRGPAIVCVHGNPTWSYMYRHLVTEFAPQYRVIVPDHLGCGFSDKPQHCVYTLDTRIQHLEQLLDHLGIAACILVVHDWGGAIGLGWAVEHASMVRGVVVLNTAAFRSTRIPFRIALCKVPLLGDLLVRGVNGFAGAARYMAVSKPLDRQVAAGYLAPYDSWKNRKAVLDFIRDIPLSPDHPSYERLRRIEYGLARLADTPMLICWGGKDFCFNDHFYRQWQQRFPNAEAHYFPQAGHYILEDAFPQMKHLLDRFFTKVHGDTPD
ncbi:MAG: alpha/beta hydrolase [Desulfobulbus propionicus]|nr:MAG: alpha/beta hydrolase [Desulfobulbus propionicus]